MRVNVTAEHIATGIYGSCRRCPIALAFQAAGFTDVQVGTNSVKLWRGRKPLLRRLPDSATAFIEDFDSERSIKPFSFEIEVPS